MPRCAYNEMVPRYCLLQHVTHRDSRMGSVFIQQHSITPQLFGLVLRLCSRKLHLPEAQSVPRHLNLSSARVPQSQLWSHIIRDFFEEVKLHPPAGFSLRLLSPAAKPAPDPGPVPPAPEDNGGLSSSQTGEPDASSVADAALLDALDDPEMPKAHSTDQASIPPRLLVPLSL